MRRREGRRECRGGMVEGGGGWEGGREGGREGRRKGGREGRGRDINKRGLIHTVKVSC